MFVHLTSESISESIRRTGIRGQRIFVDEIGTGTYAMPVVRNFFMTHQWLRELKRGRSETLVGVYFRIPDDQPVWVGHYNQNHRQMSAAEAIGIFEEADDLMGWEVIIPRRIEAAEIHRIRHLPQVTGWRYSPGSNGKKPYCTCSYCIRGKFGSQKLRKRFEQQQGQ